MIILGLLAHKASGDEELNILLYRRPDKILTNSCQGLCDTHVASSEGGVKFHQDGGDERRSSGWPYATLLQDEVVVN